MLPSTITSTGFTNPEDRRFERTQPIAVVLLAHARPGSCTVDRCAVGGDLSVGRGQETGLCVNDDKISKQHFCIRRETSGFVIEDLNSKNGTFLNGEQLVGRRTLPDSAVIRAGQTIFVFHSSGGPFLEPPPLQRFGIAGRFHVAPLIRQLEMAAQSKRNVLLAGPSGVGKELAAHALNYLMERDAEQKNFVIHNSARFSSEEEVMVSIFGVGAKVFSNVDARPGLIEKASPGVLFLDEIHNLPERIQRGLLRVIEEGLFARIGETKERPAEVGFIFATNAPGPGFGVAHDLLARLLLVPIPSLAERIADIPSIFDHVLGNRLNQLGRAHDPITPLLSANHYEAMCLDKFERFNVRGLTDLADRLVGRIAAGAPPQKAVAEVFTERFDDSLFAARVGQSEPPLPQSRKAEPAPVRNSVDSAGDNKPPQAVGTSVYEHQKNLIIATFRDRERNIAATERILRAQGIQCSRRWLAVYLKKWGEHS